MAVGLATESRDEYYATNFGERLTELLCVFPEFARYYLPILNATKKPC